MQVSPAAPRLDGLDGKTIAFVWDYVFRGDDMFPVIERRLLEMYDEVRFVSYDAFGSIFGGDEEAVLADLPAKLKALDVDGAICGVGC